MILIPTWPLLSAKSLVARARDVEFEECLKVISIHSHERVFLREDFVALADQARMTKVVSERRMVLALQSAALL